MVSKVPLPRQRPSRSGAANHALPSRRPPPPPSSPGPSATAPRPSATSPKRPVSSLTGYFRARPFYWSAWCLLTFTWGAYATQMVAATVSARDEDRAAPGAGDAAPSSSPPSLSARPDAADAQGGSTQRSLLARHQGTPTNASHASPAVPDAQRDPAVHARFAEIAPGYDELVRPSEAVMRMGRLRRRLAAAASGDVLESAVGTGRNAAGYDAARCTSLTVVDRSREMVQVAREKWDAEAKVGQKIHAVRFLVGDVEGLANGLPVEECTGDGDGERKLQLGTTGRRFDTVVQTMGLCSTTTPVQQLRALGTLVKPAEQGGRILLLEHGRGHYGWLNGILDRDAGQHARKMGCWWNRNIGDIVERSGLEVVRIKRYHWGTTWWVELKRPAKWTDKDVHDEPD